MHNTLRPKDVPGGWLGGLVGVTSTWVKGAGEEGINDVNWGFNHSSQSCAILVKAVFSRSGYHKKIQSLLSVN